MSLRGPTEGIHHTEGAKSIHRSPTSKQGVDEAAIKAFAAIRELDTERVVVLSFRALQLKRIGELQDQLFALQEGFAAGGLRNDQNNTQPELDGTLRQYAEALRNYETLSQNTLPFIPPGSQLIGRLQEWTGKRRPKPENFWKRQVVNIKIWLAELKPKILPWSQKYTASEMAWYIETFQTEGAPASQIAKSAQEKLGLLGFRELDKVGREERDQRKAFTQRLFMALFGGVALIAPMLIMVLRPTRNVSLVTTSVATILFALILAFGAQDSSGKDVLAATAAYAAVLVVFVGTSTSTSSSSPSASAA